MNNQKTTTGTVVSHRRPKLYENIFWIKKEKIILNGRCENEIFIPTIAYQVDQKTYLHEISILYRGYFPKLAVGQTVDVLYDADNPQICRIKERK